MTWVTSIDQLNQEVALKRPPQRIISLVPSQTELLFDLGLDDQIVGVTKFCVHPAHARKTKAIIGGTKHFDLDRIHSLKPDLVIGNKEENYPEGIAELCRHYPVWMSDVVDVQDALFMVSEVARITDRALPGQKLLMEINASLNSMPLFSPRRTLYLMWHEPWMGAASGTFIHALMEKSGLVNVLANVERYPVLTDDQINALQPEIVMLSSEPFPFAEKHLSKLKPLLLETEFIFVDGEYFSWYGSRLREAATYFGTLKARLS
jgi:ABC-type Fe3+-hydroxamate transport system substrate-binding protein